MKRLLLLLQTGLIALARLLLLGLQRLWEGSWSPEPREAVPSEPKGQT
ncbi:hypothetical protein [Robiginitalea sediminis]|nr:hypothetical protein [Robiginitalea sediminis]